MEGFYENGPFCLFVPPPPVQFFFSEFAHLLLFFDWNYDTIKTKYWQTPNFLKWRNYAEIGQKEAKMRHFSILFSKIWLKTSIFWQKRLFGLLEKFYYTITNHDLTNIKGPKSVYCTKKNMTKRPICINMPLHAQIRKTTKIKQWNLKVHHMLLLWQKNN